ncbi:5'-nucleotidase [Peribacillus deserti]|uniref:5'-nucleotidase n=1 Tax=Peribacillus deserti TaxID=673318 RepID=A0ABS2QCA8_9BACI|nr:bifunctional UDP-sugar hydrolase/5'-nucleotidase [Peribacillus deserti]MBM7690801.1 5'-nucleotidase [Peribacillus deserti]
MKRKSAIIYSAALTFTLLFSFLFEPIHTPAEETSKSDSNLVNLQLLGITDFHGYLQAYNDKSNGQIWSPEGQLFVGGAAYNAAHLKRLKEGHNNSIVLSAGDNFSGWPFEVAAHRDEPTIEFMNAVGVQMSAVGNHELDESEDFLLKHIDDGKCFGKRDIDSCFKDSSGQPFDGADFPFISANVRDAKSGKLITKPYIIKQIPDGKGQDIPVGFIGLTITDTITGTTSFQEGNLTVDPLLESANRYAKELQNLGVESIVAVVHEGGSAGGYYQGCSNQRGPVFDFARDASSAIDAIFTGHWHAAFNCSIDDPEGNPRPVIEGANHGKLISEISLSINPSTKEVVRSKTIAVNHPVTRDVTPDQEVAKMVEYWVERGNQRWAEPVAKITGDLTLARNENGESSLADVVADAHYSAGRKARMPADFALTASSPLHKDLLYAKGTNSADQDGQILFGEMWNAHGYANPVVVVTLTGREVKQILEEQWRKKTDGTEAFYPLAVSHNVHYSFSKNNPPGQRIDPADVIINGRSLDLDKTYRVAALAYLIRGNDGYPAFLKYTDPVRVESDHWAFLNYLKRQEVIKPPELNRVSSTN